MQMRWEKEKKNIRLSSGGQPSSAAGPPTDGCPTEFSVHVLDSSLH